MDSFKKLVPKHAVGIKQLKQCTISGFANLNLNRIYLTVLQSHDRALQLYEKCEFQLEGCHRCTIYKNGNYHDLNQMAILKNNWTNRRRGHVEIEHWEFCQVLAHHTLPDRF